uniref:Elongation of very long chain fatty acids protein n=1 Tax=Timema cristinae TaxID=61476 RepID=A0A7R9HB69_TIMCR|nr:unnamed protein product [Timema cristinae]
MISVALTYLSHRFQHKVLEVTYKATLWFVVVSTVRVSGVMLTLFPQQVFFVLRKKQKQVSFLHVYHHTVTALFSWGYLKFLPGETRGNYWLLELRGACGNVLVLHDGCHGTTVPEIPLVEEVYHMDTTGMFYDKLPLQGHNRTQFCVMLTYLSLCPRLSYVDADLLTQFCLMLTYLLSLLAYDCKLPKILTFFFVGNVLVFLCLFLDFYKKAYSSKKLTE